MKNKYLLSLTLLTILLLSGCGNSSSSTPTTNTSPAPAATQNNLDETELSTQLKGKTFYLIDEEEGSSSIQSITFNEDLSSFTFKEENTSISLEDGQLLIADDNQSLTIKEVTTDYILINIFTDSKLNTIMRFYFEESKATAYLDSLDTILTSLIVDTTQYTINSNGVISTKVLQLDGAFTENVTLANDRNFDAVGTYTIQDRVLTLTRDTGVIIVATYVSHNAEYITLSASLNGGEAFESYWFLTEDARNTDGVALIE